MKLTRTGRVVTLTLTLTMVSLLSYRLGVGTAHTEHLQAEYVRPSPTPAPTPAPTPEGHYVAVGRVVHRDWISGFTHKFENGTTSTIYKVPFAHADGSIEEIWFLEPAPFWDEEPVEITYHRQIDSSFGYYVIDKMVKVNR